MITYRATLDVPDHFAHAVAGWLAEHRLAHDIRPWQRAASPLTQAIMFLRWARDATRVDVIARDAGVSQATAYRYIHEAVDVVAAHGTDLGDALGLAEASGEPFLMIDGTLVPSNRCRAKNPETGHDLWYSGKHKRHGANVQVLMDSCGYPLWASPGSPGSTHDLAAAREHVLPALYPRAARGLPVLADKGYIGAGRGIHTPVRGHSRDLDTDTRCRNQLICDPRAPCERSNAMLKTWKCLTRDCRHCPMACAQNVPKRPIRSRTATNDPAFPLVRALQCRGGGI
ncbi:MAG: transposase [Bifidobacteriaceae bacterium]|nr:transposase [Bifidobacteriaceae bacterium]